MPRALSSTCLGSLTTSTYLPGTQKHKVLLTEHCRFGMAGEPGRLWLCPGTSAVVIPGPQNRPITGGVIRKVTSSYGETTGVGSLPAVARHWHPRKCGRFGRRPIFVLAASKGCKQSLYNPRFKVDLNHCARFVFLSPALSTKPALPPMWQRLLLLAPAAYGSKEGGEYSEARSQCVHNPSSSPF